MLIKKTKLATILSLAFFLAVFGQSPVSALAGRESLAREVIGLSSGDELPAPEGRAVSEFMRPGSWSRPFFPFFLPVSWQQFLERVSREQSAGDSVEIAGLAAGVQQEIQREIQTETKELKKEDLPAEKLERKPAEKQEVTGQEPSSAEKKKRLIDWLDPWKKTLELSYVVTSGNTLSSSFSFGANLTRSPNEKDTYTMRTFLLRSHSTTITRRAVGTEDNYTVEEERTRRLSAENYLLSGQYDHRVSGRLTTNLAFVWDRNKFSGVLSRALWTAGAGLVMADSARTKMRTQAGLSFTIRKYSQQPVNTFLGFRYTLSWEQKLFDNASFATAFIFDDNLAHLSDWRYEWNFNVAAPLNKKLSLKTGVRILRNNKPPDLNVPLFTPEGEQTGLTVLIPRGKVDTFFTTSLVLNF